MVGHGRNAEKIISDPIWMKLLLLKADFIAVSYHNLEIIL
jgi:hypothetical protein